jgi:predicted phosphate transport protein (TIGR00153 family)
MKFRIIPREEKFFELFQEQAENAVEAAKVLKDLLENYNDVDQKRLKIEMIENNGDEIAHRIFEKLNLTFVTPMDREDIHALACALDDIVDIINATSQRLQLYNVGTITEDAKLLANIILRATEETAVIATSLNNVKNLGSLKQHWIEVNRLENEADKISRHAIADLFSSNRDPIDVIKWKELYEHLETVTDKCEDVSDIVEGVALKNA